MKIENLNKKDCRHIWRRGSWNGGIKGKKIIKTSLNAICTKCGKKIKIKW